MEEIMNLVCWEYIGGRLPHGARFLGEEEIGGRLGASRSAAREAVKILAAKGLLQTRPRRGSRIRPIKDWNFFDPAVLAWLGERAKPRLFFTGLLEMRLAFEGEAAALAAGRTIFQEHSGTRAAFGAM